MNQSVPHTAVSLRNDAQLPYWTAYSFIALVIVGIGLFTSPALYADFDAYIYYLDALVHFPASQALYFEALSNTYLLSAHWLTRSVYSAVVLGHYVLGLLFVALMVTAFPPRRSSWASLLFMFAILGPLLAFVTIRATPAYFFIAIGVRYAIDRKPVAWLFLVAAALFHISALLAVLPMALLYFENRLPRFIRSHHSRRFYLVVALGIIVIGAIVPQLSSSVTSLIQSIPVVSKYDVYTSNNATETQIGHYLFLVFVSALTIAFITVRDMQSQRLNVYVLASFALYVLMFFSASPVAAFRQAPFWIMPMIALLPWDRLGVRQAAIPFFILFCTGLFVFQFDQVYS